MSSSIVDRGGPDKRLGKVWVSRTVLDLVAGSGIELVPRERRTLKGVPGAWELFLVAAGSTTPVAIAPEPPSARGFDRPVASFSAWRGALPESYEPRAGSETASTGDA